MKADEIQWFKIRNWEKFQHYKDRNPVWIKLHTSLLTDYKFNRLSSVTQLTLIKIWLVMSTTDNHRMNTDQNELRFKLRSKRKIDLKPLFDAEFLELCEDPASNTLADGEQDACLETEKRQRQSQETEKETESCSVIANLPALDLIWNQHRGSLPEISNLTEKRLKRWSSRWLEKPDEGYWVHVVKKLAASPFCCGESESGWKATVDFLLRPDSHVKIFEGAYDSKTKNKAESRLKSNLNVAKTVLEAAQ